MRPIQSAMLAVCVGLVFGSAPRAQTDTAVRAAVAALPTDLRGTANDFLSTRRSILQRIDLAAELAEDPSPACLNFLVLALERETSVPVRRALVGFVGRRADERPDDRMAALLERFAADPDQQTGTLASSHRATFQARRSNQLFSPLSMASVSKLVDPPPEPVKLPGQTIRFGVLGDFGTCEKLDVAFNCIDDKNDRQKRVARALSLFHTSNGGAARLGFGLTAGDNFYQTGVKNEDDPRWKHDWEDRYSVLGIEFHAVLGNHDHDGGSSSVDGQIAYTKKSASWRMTARYRPLQISDGALVQMFALDTEVLFKKSDPQLEWLGRVLNDARANTPNAWRIVVGHHPVVSGGEHGVKGHLEEYRKQLLPVLKAGGTHLYVAGHDHDLQLLKIDGVYQMVAGGGGQDEREVEKVSESVFCRKGYGFAVVEATETELRLNYLSDQEPPKSVYACTITRDPASGKLSDNCALACK